MLTMRMANRLLSFVGCMYIHAYIHTLCMCMFWFTAGTVLRAMKAGPNIGQQLEYLLATGNLISKSGLALQQVHCAFKPGYFTLSSWCFTPSLRCFDLSLGYFYSSRFLSVLFTVRMPTRSNDGTHHASIHTVSVMCMCWWQCLCEPQLISHLWISEAVPCRYT